MTRAIRKHLGDFIALVVLFVIAIGVSGYIIFKQDARPYIPVLESTPFKLKADFSTAQAVTPGQGQSVRVAGVQIGKITQVGLKNGMAEVLMEIDPKWPKKVPIRSDATALLRPRTGLKDMFIELDPGVSGTPLKSGATIPIANTAPDINPDEFLSVFDTDTRQYLQLLINSGGKGLQNRGNDLNQVFKALQPTYHDLNRISSAIAQRHNDLKELIHRYGDLTNALADKDREIRTLVNSSNAVFQSFASQQANISSAVAKLPPTLQQTTRTLLSVNTFSNVLRPTLNNLRPAFRQLATTNQEVLPFVREAYPITKNHIRPFVQVARPYVRQLRPASINLAKAAPDLTGTFHELNRFFNMGAYNPNGAEPLYPTPQQNAARDEGMLFWLAWTAQDTVSMFSTSDANGPLRRVALGLACETIKQQLISNPLGGPLLGLSNALNDPGLCGNGGQPGPGVLPALPPLPKQQAGKTTAAPTPGKPTSAIKPTSPTGKPTSPTGKAGG